MTSPETPPTARTAGQAEQLRAMHDAHSLPLQRYVLRLTRGDQQFAEDVVQESLLRLWQKPEVLARPSESVRAWLNTVAKNLVIDDRRSARFTREQQTDEVPERHTPDIFGPSVDKMVLADVLRSLSPEHRAAIVRTYYLGQTISDIAAHERVPPGTVKSRLHYAVRALRTALEERGVVR
jgi:RNA polymerase sigma-70 factor (ECF subfamily)